MRTMLMALLAVAVATPAALGGDGKAEIRKEKKRLAGTWALVSGEVDGKAVAAEHVKKGRVTHAGGKVTVVTPHQSG